MPTYDYKCPKCYIIEERQQKINSQYKCPMCENCDIPMIMQISRPAGVHFKGSGFYETDYKNKAK